MGALLHISWLPQSLKAASGTGGCCFPTLVAQEREKFPVLSKPTRQLSVAPWLRTALSVPSWRQPGALRSHQLHSQLGLPGSDPAACRQKGSQGRDTGLVTHPRSLGALGLLPVKPVQGGKCTCNHGTWPAQGGSGAPFINEEACGAWGGGGLWVHSGTKRGMP